MLPLRKYKKPLLLTTWLACFMFTVTIPVYNEYIAAVTKKSSTEHHSSVTEQARTISILSPEVRVHKRKFSLDVDPRNQSIRIPIPKLQNFEEGRRQFHQLQSSTIPSEQNDNVRIGKPVNKRIFEPDVNVKLTSPEKPDENTLGKVKDIPKTKSRLDITNVSAVLTEPVITPFLISYRHNNPKLHCQSTKPIFLIAVPSAPGNFKRREKLRKAWKRKYSTRFQDRVKILFFLGTFYPPMINGTRDESKAKILQDSIEKEMVQFNDMIQATFDDNYQNVTMKAALLLHWSSTYCRKAKFLIRIDDDVAINVTDVTEAVLAAYQSHEHFIIGKRKLNGSPIRDPHSKWAKYLLTEDQWPSRKKFPPFVLGATYAFPIPTAGLLLATMRRTPFIWLDDIFVTGVCAERLGVPVLDHEALYFGHGRSL